MSPQLFCIDVRREMDTMIGMEKETTQQSFTMRVDREFLDALDRGREKQIPTMSRSDYIRKLVLEADRRKR